MTTSEDDIDRMETAILAAMTDDDTPAWSTPDDLSRISVEALIADDSLGRTLPSRGNIRLSGDGVTGASARVSEVARVMAGFQRLATAVGAAQQGDKALGRQPNADVRRRTDLLLRASPGPGSIILTVTPATSPITETGHAGGKVGMFAELETDDQLLDTAIGAAIDVFSAGNDIGPSPAQSRFVQQLAEMGPRTASALRDLSKTLDRAGFDIEIDWQQPSHATRRVTVSSTAAAYIAATVENANLDEQPVHIIGEYLTVSAVSSWLIQQDDGDTVTVKLGRIGKDEAHGLAVGDRVRIEALMKVETTPGGAVKTTYTAQAVRSLDDQH
ncbi:MULTISPECIES: hypothetical protein [Mycobacteriaceae]|jgi:hypothetical protein|nr:MULTISPECIES: hypothetical protein [Mycobacteriaceae]MEE3062594.1 hypothetical protein [Actinomycetota bacterium]MCQ4362301.1 hypothetical protein [Mycobacterium gordonae]MDO2386960.1 hypothetical protein [Mycobacterium avium subsp. hominissuis]MDO2397442.1 hypothetical protein [Mycobacterium avium subsp. hominissuis]GAY17240.1 hypothetical protein MSZK_39660 [Mycobacterium sp. shizuoka-1]